MKPIRFDYRFAAPHRITVCLPDSSHKLLCDADAEGFTLGWCDRAVRDVRRDGLFEPLKANEKVRFTALINGEAAPGVDWTRADGWFPALQYTFEKDGLRAVCTVAACETAFIVRLTARNTAAKPAQLRVGGRSTSLFNKLWTDRENNNDNAMIGNIKFPPDQVVLYSPQPDAPSEIFRIENAFCVQPHQTAEGWFILPHEAWLTDLPRLQRTDWAAEYETYFARWKRLIDRSAPITLPDPALKNAFLACLADLFVMREPQKSGHVVSLCGTELYRCTNPCEPVSACSVLGRLGYLDEARDGLFFSLGSAEADGSWNEPNAWPHDSWLPSGMKALAAMEHYRLTGDTDFLRRYYPNFVGSVRRNEAMRATTLGDPDPAKRGLMPRGMGDGGLGENGDMYGVFYPHNFYCCAAARLATEAARILDKPEEGEMRASYEDFLACIEDSLALGAMTEPDGSRWIGGCPGSDGGSRWSAVDCVYPCELLDENDPLVTGTLAKIDRDISAGGLPLNMGWIKGGLWVAIAIDNTAVVRMLRGDTQTVVDYLYAALNHASPLLSWCEERTPEPNATTQTGDRQHLWTPLAVCKTVLASLLLFDEQRLYLGLCPDPDWVGNWGIKGGRTPWGAVGLRMTLGGERIPVQVRLEKLPPKLCVRGSRVENLVGARQLPDEKGLLVLEPTADRVTFDLLR